MFTYKHATSQAKWSKFNVNSLLFSGGIFFPLIIACMFSYSIIYNLLITTSQQKALLQVQNGRDEIDHWLENRKTEISTIADTPTQLDGSWKYIAYVHLKQANWSLALVIPCQTIESPLYSLNLLAIVVGSLMSIAIFGAWRQIRLFQLAEAIAQEKSQLHAQTQAQVKLLDESLQERQIIEQRLRQQTQDLTNTLRKLHETQFQLLQSEKMSSLGQLVAGIAHEINGVA